MPSRHATAGHTSCKCLPRSRRQPRPPVLHVPAAAAHLLCAEPCGLPCLCPLWARAAGGGGLVRPSRLQTRKAALLVPASGWGSPGPPGVLMVSRAPPPPLPNVTCRPSDRTTSSAQLQPSCAGPFPAEASSWAWEGPLLPAQKPVSLLSVACPAPPASQESPGLRGSRVLPPPLLPFLYW